jgi:hypothetical protein
VARGWRYSEVCLSVSPPWGPWFKIGIRGSTSSWPVKIYFSKEQSRKTLDAAYAAMAESRARNGH